MGRIVISPAVDRMLLGFAAAVPVAAYSGALGVALFSWTHGPPGSVASLGTAIRAMLLLVLLVGTSTLPVAFLAGLPALLIACWLVVCREAQSMLWFLLLGVLCAAALAWLLLPLFHPSARESRDLSEPDVLAAVGAGLLSLAPAGLLAGWVFWRIGVRSKLARDLQ